MNLHASRFNFRIVLAAGALTAFALAATGSSAVAQKHSSTSSSSSSTTSSSKPAASSSSRPATNGSGSSGGGNANGAQGARAGSGPTTSHPGGPTTSSPGGRTTTGPTTGNPSGRTTTTSTTRTPTGIAAPMTHTGSYGGRTPNGSRTASTANGAVTTRANGKVSDVHDNKTGMDVHNNLNGSRRSVTTRPDGTRVVAEKGRPSYAERTYHMNGHDYARRDYYWRGRDYPRFFRGYYINGVYVDVYAPVYYYSPAFYGWVYNPWYGPAPYAWGWAGVGWYGYYGFYFAPYPYYAAPSDWLTDYVISQDLQFAYAQQQEAQIADAAPQPAGQPLLTPEIKAQIAEEVKAQIQLENAEAQQNAQGQDINPALASVNRMFLDGKPHVFVADQPLDVVDASGNECALSDGDVLRLTNPPAQGDTNATTATLSVVVSKGGNECPASASVTVAIADLQEMQNGMRDAVDRGMQELQANQGTNGLPAAPASAMTRPAVTAIAKGAPPAEPDLAVDIQQQIAAADQVAAQAGPAGSADSQLSGQAAAPATINIGLGQSVADVTAALGQPVSIIDLGVNGKVYKYKDMKIKFKAGKVVDVDVE